MTQEQVAEKMNVDRSTVRRWEKGDKIPGYDESKKLSQLYNMPLDYIFFGKRTRFQRDFRSARGKILRKGEKMKTDTQKTTPRKTVREISDEVMELLKKEHLTADKAWDVLEAVRRKVHESAFSKPL